MAQTMSVTQLQETRESQAPISLPLVDRRGSSRSDQALQEAKELITGGSSSPVRLWTTLGGKPFFAARAKGAHVWDVDGNRYLDYALGLGPQILGHGHPEVLAAIHAQVDAGCLFGIPSDLEVRLARVICERYPAIEQTRFVASGTEATLGAVRIARAFTRRSAIVKMQTGYHGSGDALHCSGRQAAGSDEALLATGVSPAVADETLIATFNDLASVRDLFAKHAQQVACIILEPMMGNHGTLCPSRAFLQGLRQLCTQHGALLIFDEVLCGFRIARGGATELFGVKPDLVTLGKIIGGGMPMGAYGGRRDVMAQLQPIGQAFQAGTYAGDPVSVAAGLKALEVLGRPGSYQKLDALCARLVGGLVQGARAAGHQAWGQHFGGMFGFCFAPGPVQHWQDMQSINTPKFVAFFHGMLARGVYWWPKPTGVAMMSLAHSEADVDATLEAACDVFKSIPVDLH